MPSNLLFVRTNGSAFELNGEEFHVNGANNYYLGHASDAMVEAVFELARSMKFNVLRTWAFLDCATAQNGVYFHYLDAATGTLKFNDGPNGLERLDRTVALAERYGIRLILPLVNYWPDFGGVDQYLAWFGLTERHQFYEHTGARQAYRDYAAHLLTRVNTCSGRRYCDEPSILAWELANEPRCVGRNGRPMRDGTSILTRWATEMSGFLKGLDTNHLVAVGDEGYFNLHGVDCERLLRVPSIDFGTCHLYPNFAPKQDPVTFGSNWIRKHIEAGHRAGKPMVVEEFGIPANLDLAREPVFRAWLDQVHASKGAGALVWMIAATDSGGEPYPDYDLHTIYS